MLLSLGTYASGLLVVLAATGAASAQTNSTVPTVKLGKTTLIGSAKTIPVLEQNLDFFGGIPFAQPPLGKLRFRAPVPFKKFQDSTFNATQFGASCLQLTLPDTSSEDCLTVNVLRPSGSKPGDKLPVMAWIYGGGFLFGNTSIYDASIIVSNSIIRQTPVIYVNFNYRLGPLGFPQGAEAKKRGDLNLGLKDQLLALQWIHDNICDFGGDPEKVTVFGESAGAISIANLFLNSNLQNLVRGAIFESGSAATTTVFTPTRPNRQQDWANFISAIPACGSVSTTQQTIPCAQQADSKAILEAWARSEAQSDEQFPWSPVIDGPKGVIPDLPSKLFEKGHFSKIPFIAGTNLDEGTIFTPPQLNYTTDLIRAIITANFTPPTEGEAELEKTVDKLLELYPDDPELGSPNGTGNETFGLSPGYKRAAQLNNDIAFQSQRRAWIQAASKAGVKTYGYLFTDPQADPGEPFIGVSHSSEIFYVYGGTLIDPNATATARLLSQIMMDYWISFATSLDPNDGKGTPRHQWTQYTPENQVLIQLNGANTTLIPDDYRKEQIAFINSNPPVFHHRRNTHMFG